MKTNNSNNSNGSQPFFSTPQPATPTDRPIPSPYPYGNQAPKEPLIRRMSVWIQNAFSHKAAFWLGVIVAIIGLATNTWFYRSLMTLAGVGVVTAIGLGILISWGTSIFELIPAVQAASPRQNWDEMHRTDSRPKVVPVGADPYSVNNYKDTDRKNHEFFRSMRIFAYAIEGFIAVIFLGNIGVGVGAMFRLLIFVAASVSIEWGVRLALRSAERELPPQTKEAADARWQAAAQNPQYRSIDR